jgi:hypothetical protein
MVRGKPWSTVENEALAEMMAQGLDHRQIYAGSRLLDRSLDAIRKHMWLLHSIAEGKSRTSVKAIRPAVDVLSMEMVVKHFCTAFEQICRLTCVDKFNLERFRIIFQAAKDYGPLLAGYEKWEKIEKQIEELKSAVAELQAAKSAKNT